MNFRHERKRKKHTKVTQVQVAKTKTQNDQAALMDQKDKYRHGVNRSNQRSQVKSEKNDADDCNAHAEHVVAKKKKQH